MLLSTLLTVFRFGVRDVKSTVAHRTSPTTSLLSSSDLVYPRYKSAVANMPILGLLRLRCPATVFLAIVSIVVNAVDTVCWRGARPHVSQESLKGRTPFAADGNPSAAIPAVTRGLGVLAPVDHQPPDFVFASLTKAVSFSTTRLAATPPTSHLVRLTLKNSATVTLAHCPERECSVFGHIRILPELYNSTHNSTLLRL